MPDEPLPTPEEVAVLSGKDLVALAKRVFGEVRYRVSMIRLSKGELRQRILDKLKEIAPPSPSP